MELWVHSAGCRSAEWTKILGWPEYRVCRHRIHEETKVLKLWVLVQRPLYFDAGKISEYLYRPSLPSGYAPMEFNLSLLYLQGAGAPQ